ncbi:beta-ketoacyl-[acyl-carrier-protein] synthase family protein [Kosakonia sacchari]|uniref:beta-ketoacyl-[acyl-carrier-protein] synthase family protein n=1 Tax=Kosakonia sacchari TaxID=1158459 RepID=UPI001362CE87|nr:beta-ketoacyl-[acyl-carrier-protein] synthase family protein [Kosakonia sacchari]QHM94155.1 beta-ketoacyl-[acyl-carrier-protein] synthase family protein [Kosakonia sacchari]
MEHRRVVITGYGAITPLGSSAEESWKSIMDYQIGYQYVDKTDASINSKFYGLIAHEPKLTGVPASIRRKLPRFARLGLAAAQEAVAMAFNQSLPADIYDPLKCGTIVGTGWGGIDDAYHNYDDYKLVGVGSPFSCFHAMPSVATAACSIMWGLRGYQNTPIAACATGSMAIGEAYELIKNGHMTMMLAGGSESLTSNASVWMIDVLQALTHEQHDIQKASCPFSLDRSGFVLSEGAAILCLEERESALARGATILGEIKGYGNFSDGVDFTAPAQDKLSRVSTIKKALADSGLSANEIGYINAHGTSTMLNDLNETQSIKDVFGRYAYEIPVSSTKSYSGHLIAAAGSFESIVCLKVLENNILPATRNLNRPDPECDLDFIPNQHRQTVVDNVLNLSFGFGGTNAALVIGRSS